MAIGGVGGGAMTAVVVGDVLDKQARAGCMGGCRLNDASAAYDALAVSIYTVPVGTLLGAFVGGVGASLFFDAGSGAVAIVAAGALTRVRRRCGQTRARPRAAVPKRKRAPPKSAGGADVQRRVHIGAPIHDA